MGALALAGAVLAPAGASAQGPTTEITSGPEGLTNDPEPVFRFTSNDPDANYECRLDPGGPYACSSPTKLGLVPDGDYLFEVRAVDSSGGGGAYASSAFTVDTQVRDLDVTAKKKQRQGGKRIKIKAKVGAQELIEAAGEGGINVRGSKRFFLLRRVKKTVQGGEATVLRLKPQRKRDHKKIFRLLQRGKRLTATASVAATDEAGNTFVEDRVVRLK